MKQKDPASSIERIEMQILQMPNKIPEIAWKFLEQSEEKGSVLILNYFTFIFFCLTFKG